MHLSEHLFNHKINASSANAVKTYFYQCQRNYVYYINALLNHSVRLWSEPMPPIFPNAVYIVGSSVSSLSCPYHFLSPCLEDTYIYFIVDLLYICTDVYICLIDFRVLPKLPKEKKKKVMECHKITFCLLSTLLSRFKGNYSLIIHYYTL